MLGPPIRFILSDTCTETFPPPLCIVYSSVGQVACMGR